LERKDAKGTDVRWNFLNVGVNLIQNRETFLGEGIFNRDDEVEIFLYPGQRLPLTEARLF
jgi:hypothetical protein